MSGRRVVIEKPETQEALIDSMKTACALIDASMKYVIDKKMIDQATKLRIISTASTGVSHIDVHRATEIGIEVRTLAEDKTLLAELTPAAELSWAFIMALATRLVEGVEHVRAGGWDREEFYRPMIKGKTIGIIGCGRIGQRMADYAAAFGMRILGYDPKLVDWPAHIKKEGLDQLLASSDFLTIHVHLAPDTRNLIGAAQFRKIKKHAILVNTSRGGIVDENELLTALRLGRLAGAGLDVLECEPNVEGSELISYSRKNDNLLITPHSGGASTDSIRLVCRRAAEKVVDRLDH